LLNNYFQHFLWLFVHYDISKWRVFHSFSVMAELLVGFPFYAATRTLPYFQVVQFLMFLIH